jgi:hypothetical protein
MRQKPEDRGQMTEVRSQMTEVRSQMQKTDDRSQKPDDRGQKTEVRRQRSEDPSSLRYAPARRIISMFLACGEGPFGRRPHYPDNPVNPVQFNFLNKNPFLFFFQIL